MRLITIQHKTVLDSLNTTGVYKANINRVSPNLSKPYRFMMSEYGYNTCPIFLAIEGRYAEMFGAKTEHDCIALELDIPDNLVKIQDYYDWADVIFYMEYPEEFSDDPNEVYEFAKETLHQTSFKLKRALQATVSELRKEWLINTLPCPDLLIRKHVGSGGRDILQPLHCYMPENT